MDVLLLAGYKRDCAQIALKKLDQQILNLQSIGLNPVVILSGTEADEVIRQSQPLRTCELVFDTNEPQDVSLMTNLKSGIQVVSQTCFVLPLEIPPPPKEIWVALKRAFQETGFTTKTAFIQLSDREGAPWHWGFPLYITRLGRHLLLQEENLHTLTDPRLTYFNTVYEMPEALAPQRYNL